MAMWTTAGLVGVVLGASALSWWGQTGFGAVAVTDLVYTNSAGTRIRAKLLRPTHVTASSPVPGVVYVHGYQNNRETSDPFCIELSRRGVAALCIDAIGRGNSGFPFDPGDPRFDATYGVAASLARLKSLDFVDAARIGVMGNSLGAELAYNAALADPSLSALVISGFAYDSRATFDTPRNMLMLFGKWDEFRARMVGGDDVAEWMSTPATRHAIADPSPEIGRTYGRFEDGTARRVVVPRASHLMVAHSEGPIAEALEWMRRALRPDDRYWLPARDQIWHLKEAATLVAMVAGFWCLIPLGWLLLATRWLRPLLGEMRFAGTASKRYFVKQVAVNACLMWLYLPLFYLLYAVHLFVARLDRAFPMMLVNGIVFWFFVINLVGFARFIRWYRRERRVSGVTLSDLGLSFRRHGLGLDLRPLAKTFVLGTGLFLFALGLESITERFFMTDFRFIFPIASDLTAERALLMPRYLPFVLLAFFQTGLFLHIQLKRPASAGRRHSFLSRALGDTAVLVVPLLALLSIQYVPLFVADTVPFVGPGNSATSFIINLFPFAGMLCLTVPLSTWFHRLTGRPYLGALVSSYLVTWMFASSQVVAPVPL
jgi:hypothetical protein